MALAQFAEYVKELADDDELAPISFVKTVQRWFESFCEGGREASLRIAFDRPTGELSYEVGISPKPGSRLAGEIATIRSGKSLFGHMVGDKGAINLSLNGNVPAEPVKEFAKLLKEAGDDLFDMFDLAIEDEKVKEQAKSVFQSLVPTVESGEFDAAVTLRGPVDNKYTFLVGLKIKEGKKVEAAVRKMVAALPKEKKNAVTMDAETINGVHVHRYVSADDAVNEMEKSIFGSCVVFFAFRDDAVVFGYGVGGAKAVGEALAQVQERPAQNFQLDISLKQIKPLCEAIEPGAFLSVSQFFVPGADRVRIYAANLEGGPALKARAVVNLQTIIGMGGDTTFFLPVAPAVPPVPPPPKP
jgi:hypothetical protein